MATAEQLLNEAQYAFANISFGESFANTRYAARAKSLCRKIIRKFPATTEASEARAILRRMGEEAYLSKMPILHRHVPQSEHHDTWKPLAAPRRKRGGVTATQREALNWTGLIGLLLSLPKTILFAVAAAGFVLFSLFGWLLAVPLVALLLFTGPFRRLLKPAERSQVDDVVARINALIDERRKSGLYS